MRKAVLKRIKITKTGKMLYRRAGKNHFNAKAARKIQLRQKRWTTFPREMEKKIRQYL